MGSQVSRLEDVVDSFRDQYQVEKGKCTAESKNAVHDIVVKGQGVEGAHRGECSGLAAPAERSSNGCADQSKSLI
jgi:hypothetical protein